MDGESAPDCAAEDGGFGRICLGEAARISGLRRCPESQDGSHEGVAVTKFFVDGDSSGGFRRACGGPVLGSRWDGGHKIFRGWGTLPAGSRRSSQGEPLRLWEPSRRPLGSRDVGGSHANLAWLEMGILRPWRPLGLAFDGGVSHNFDRAWRLDWRIPAGEFGVIPATLRVSGGLRWVAAMRIRRGWLEAGNSATLGGRRSGSDG